MQAQTTTKKANGKKPVNLKTENVSSEQVILDSQQSLSQRLRAANEKLIREACDSLGVPVPSWKRVVITYVAAMCAGYGLGTLFILVDALLLSSLMATSVFLYWAVWAVGLLLTLYAGFKLGNAIGNYIMSGQIDRDIAVAKNKVSGWFKRTPALAAA